MRAIEAARKPLAAIAAGATIEEAAEQMDEKAVGALIVVDEDELAVGIVTDRDLVVRGLARRVPGDGRVDSLMSPNLVTLDAGADVRQALPLFREHAIRRLPLTRNGEIVAMLTVDDLFVDMVADLADLMRPVAGQVLFGHAEPGLPVTVSR